MKGKFSIVLHTHLPFCLGKGRWPFGEEWLFETVFDTYLPLLKVLNELVEEGKRFKIVVGLTPVLLEQLKSYYFKEKFLEYLDQKEELGKKDLVHFKGNPTYTKLTEYYLREIEDIRNLFVSLNEDIVSGFISLERKGFVELITSAATHAYLPLLKNDLSREVEV
ncbi:MAG TPA: 1,4-alpha-glucan branching protein, partial [Firmicutes bacterium]|nr:1,4-alpha-glucan branching protein [Bacillota bacterium]